MTRAEPEDRKKNARAGHPGHAASQPPSIPRSGAAREAFARHGIPEWIGITPDLGGERWTEIENWIRDQGIQDHAAVVNQAANSA